MDRRSFLRYGSVATVAGIAGCSGGGDGDGGGSSTTETTTSAPEFADPSVSVAGSARVGEALEFAVEVTNEGTAAGDFAATLQVTGPQERTREVRIEDVGAGASGSTTVGIEVGYAGTYTARLRGTEASAEARVEPREVALGEAAGLADAFELTVEEASVEPTVIAEGPGPYYLRGSTPHVLPVDEEGDPAEEDVCLVVDASVTNTGESARAFDPAGLSLSAAAGEDPSFYSDVGREVFEGVPIAGASATLGGDPLAGAEVPAGGTKTGWLLAAVDRETVAEGRVELGIQRDGEGTTPEAVWEVVPDGGASLPRFEAETLSLPEKVPNATTAEFSVTVTNTGEAEGAFRDVLEIAGNLPELDPVGRVTAEVGPGETVEVTGGFLMAWARRQAFRLQAHGVEPVSTGNGIEFGALCEGTWLELGFGEPATLTTGVTVNVSSPVFADGFDWGNPRSSYSTNVLIAALTSRLPEEIRGEGLSKELLPGLDEFKINYDPSPTNLEPIRVLSESDRDQAQKYGNTLASPVVGELYPVTLPNMPTDGLVQGWAVFINNIEGYPNEERGILLTKIIKPHDRETPGKAVGIEWSEKYE